MQNYTLRKNNYFTNNGFRSEILSQLLYYNIRGEMYDIILNIYSQIKSKIVYNNEFSPFFNLKNGVRQVEKFSAFFPIYFNDLHDFINSSHVQGLPTISELFETKLNVFFKTICHFVRRSQMTLYY